MSLPMPCTDCSSISTFPDTGFGAEVKGLKKYYEKELYNFRNAETLGRTDEILESLNEIFEECSMEGWDGYDAPPITEEAYYEAEKLIRSLPFTAFPMPEITPEPNGDIGLEWNKGTSQVFVASVSGRNEIIYAGLFGRNKVRGTEYFGDILPAAVIVNLQRLYD